MERQLRHELANLQGAQIQLLSEHTRAKASLSEMAQLRADLATARAEMARLSQPVDQAQAELPSHGPETKGSPQTSDAAAKMGMTGPKALKPQSPAASPVEKPLLQDRTGQSAAKIRVQGVHNATERPQRGKASKPTELDTASLRQLTTSAEAQTH